jgi:hypothetical protein
LAGLDISYDAKEGNLELGNIALVSEDLFAYGYLNASDLKNKPMMEGEFVADDFSLRGFFERLGLDTVTNTRDPNAYSKASFSVKLNLAENKLRMPLSVVLDDTALRTDISADLSGEKAAITIPLIMDNITLDRYLPPIKPKEVGPPAPHTANPAQKAKDINITLPKIDLSPYPDIDLKMHIGSFLVNGATIGNFDMDAGLKNSSLDLRSLSAAFFGGTLTANGKVTGQKNKTLEGNLFARMTETNLHDALTVFAPNMVKEGIPKTGSFIMQASLVDNIAKLTNSELKLDDVILKADVEADLNKKLSVRANINVNDVVLDKYIAPPVKKEDMQVAEAAEHAPITPSPALLPLESLTGIGANLVGNIKVNSITYRNVTMRTISSRLVMRDGIARLSPTTASFYKGNVQADITVRRGRTGDFNNYITLGLTSVSAGEMISALGKTHNPFLTGMFSAHMNLNAKGLLISDVISSLNGEISYGVNNAVIHGFTFNPDLFTSDMLGFWGGMEKTTAISPVSGTGTIKNGELTIEPLWVKANYLGASLKGGLGIVDHSLHFDGTVRLSDANVPFKIGGDYTKPQFNLDKNDLRNKLIVELTKNTGKGLIKTPLKILNGISDIVEQGLDSLLPEE